MKQTPYGSQSVPEESTLDCFDETYDPDLSCLLFHALTNGTKEKDKPEVLNELVHQMAPLVKLVASVELNPNLGGHSTDVIKLEALEYLYFMLISDAYVPPHISQNSWIFTRYFWTIIKRGLQSGYRKNYDQPVFDCIEYGREEPIYGRVPTHSDTETRIYLTQFYRTVLQTCIDDIRFTGVEKKACIYIGMCLIGLINFHPHSARFRYGLKYARARFLTDYMEHLIKATIYEVRRIEDEI